MQFDLGNFQKIYYEKVKPLEEKFENEKRTIYIILAVIFIITVFLEIYLFSIISLTANLSNIPIFIFIVFMFLSTLIIANFTSKVKKTIYPALFKSIDSNLIYHDKFKVPENQFIDSKLYTAFGGSYTSKDCITCKSDNKNIEMYELAVETGSGKSRTIVFSGLFINIILDKSLKTDMKIVYNTTKDYGLIKTLFANEDKVNLENIDFENMYDVYCKDQIYARKIITLSFMEKLIDVTNKYKRTIQISFRNNNIYITISGLELINDGALFYKKIDIINIAKEIDNIFKIIDTINYLNLDEKIV